MQGDTSVPKPGMDTEVVAGSRKKERTKKERARSIEEASSSEEKMKAHVGSKKKHKKEIKNTKTKETPKVDEPRTWELGTIREGYDGPLFSDEVTRFKEEPSGKRKKQVFVRLSEGLLEYMANKTYPPPRQPVFSIEPRYRAIEERLVARQKAKAEARVNMIKRYKVHGYVEVLVNETYVEEEEEEE